VSRLRTPDHFWPGRSRPYSLLPSTREGAGFGDGNFSVRCVLGAENSKAGTELADWYGVTGSCTTTRTACSCSNTPMGAAATGRCPHGCAGHSGPTVAPSPRAAFSGQPLPHGAVQSNLLRVLPDHGSTPMSRERSSSLKFKNRALWTPHKASSLTGHAGKSPRRSPRRNSEKLQS